jgi:hypothetical protein
MVVECTQTTHQKETITLIKDFFRSEFSPATRWWGTDISMLFDITGIKFDKPFMAEVFEGSFTTNSLLKKYPIKASQVMYIFTIRGKYSYSDDKTYCELKSTRVYHYGKVYTDGNNNLRWGNEKYFNFRTAPTYYTLDDYNTCRQQAIKTLVLVADKDNIVEKDNRISVPDKEYDLLQNIFNGYDDYKAHRVVITGKADNKYCVALRNGRGKMYSYHNSYCFEPIDHSGYCVVAFRKSLINRLGKYRNHLKLKRVVTTDYSWELKTRHDEIIVLKNLIATSIISNTGSKELITLTGLMDKITDITRSHENIISKLNRSREAYEKCEHKSISSFNFGCYEEVTGVLQDIEYLDRSILYIRTKLFDEVLQQDI